MMGLLRKVLSPAITSACLLAALLIGLSFACTKTRGLSGQLLLVGAITLWWIWLARRPDEMNVKWTSLGLVGGGVFVSYCVSGNWESLLLDLAVVGTSWKYLLPDGQEMKPVAVRATGLFGTVEYESMHFTGVLVEEYSSHWNERLSQVKTDANGGFALPVTSDGAVHFLKITWPGAETAHLRVEIAPDAKPLLVRLKPGKPRRIDNWGD